MKKIKAILLVLLAILSFAACEKDDICVDGDTPLLIIRFYNLNDTTATKAVPKLRVVGLGQNTTVNTIADRSSALDSIGIPLRIGEANTRFLFITNSADNTNGAETGNIDTLTFTYETKEVFVSRACGFVANYDNLKTDTTTADSERWIQNIIVEDSLVQNQAAAHVKIYH